MNHQVLLLFCINLFSAMRYSLIAPLFPSLGNERNISESLIGWIISTFALFNFMTTPLTPYLSLKYGRKNIFVFSTILEASCTFFYGLLYLIPSHFLLILLVFLSRILHGIGSGITGTLVYSLTSSLCQPKEIKVSLGYLEVAWSLGVAIGPLLGSFFYYLGGYSLPFYVLGLALFISVYLIHYLQLPIDDNQHDNNNFSFINLLFNKDIILNSLTIVIYIISNTYYFPSLTNHLNRKYGLSISISSLFFVINMVSYFISLQFLDYMTVKLGMNATVSLGLIFIIIGALLVFPISIFPQNIIFVIIGLILIGASGAPINVPALILLGKIIKDTDSSLDEYTCNDISSAIYNFGTNIGDFCGPIFGGYISDKYGFEYSCGYTSLLCLGIFILYCCNYLTIIIEEIKKENNNIKDSFNRSLLETEDFGKKSSNHSSFISIRFDIIGHRRHISYYSIHRIESQTNTPKISLIQELSY